jgi:hypothetical protein
MADACGREAHGGIYSLGCGYICHPILRLKNEIYKFRLKIMAMQFLQYQVNFDDRCKMLLMMLSYSTGVPQHLCLEKIKALANS